MRVESPAVAFDLRPLNRFNSPNQLTEIAINSIVMHKQWVMEPIKLMIHFLRLLRNDRESASRDLSRSSPIGRY